MAVGTESERQEEFERAKSRELLREIVRNNGILMAI